MPAPTNTNLSLNQILDQHAAENQDMPDTSVQPVIDARSSALSATMAPSNLEAKLQRVVEASRNKIAALDTARQALAAQTKAFDANEAANAKSWVGRLGLDPNSLTGETVNLGASVLTGASRQLAGAIISLPHSLAAGAADAELDDNDIAAYNRYVAGKATDADKVLLNTKRNLAGNGVTGFAAAKGSMEANPGMTVLELAKQAQDSRAVARKVNDFFDISSIEHGANKRALDNQLGESFAGDWAKVTGKDQGAYLFGDAPGLVKPGNIPVAGEKYSPGSLDMVDTPDGVALVRAGQKGQYAKDGKNFGTFKDADAAIGYLQSLNAKAVGNPGGVLVGVDAPAQSKLSRAGDIASGLAGLLVHAGDAALKNPKAVAEYVAENAPQLLVGGLGAGGKVAMTAANVGYAADYYQQGVEKFQKDNGGQLPAVAQRREIAAWAASLALAEEVGDHVGLDAMKFGKKAAAAEAKTGMVAALKSTLGAAAEGALGETLTEGYQTFAEGKASGTPATAADIYKGAVIGGLSGAALSGGVHAIAEITGTTPEKAAERADQVKTAVAFKDAVANNTPEVFLNRDERSYNPALAMGVLFEQNQKEDATPENRVANIQRGIEIMQNLDTRADELKDTLKNGSKAEIKDAQAELKTLDRHVTTSEKILDQMNAEHTAKFTPEQVTATVEAANAPADQSNTDAVSSVINLSMASTSHLTVEQADTLASNMDNALTDEQRGYLRKFSEARQMENTLSTMGKVSQEVLHGSDKNVGISQYRARIAAAITAGDTDVAQKQVGMLTAFAADHLDKAKVAREALRLGMGTQIVKVEGTGWKIVPAGQEMSRAGLKKNGGLEINSGRLVQNITTEAKALVASRDEMDQAVSMRFASNGLAAQQAPAVQSVPAAPAPQPAPATATPLPSATTQQTSQENNNYPQGNGKDEARLESGTPEAVAGTPQSLPKVSVNQQADQHREIADSLGLTQKIAGGFAAGKSLRDIHRELKGQLPQEMMPTEQAMFVQHVRQTLNIPAASPSSTPTDPLLAGARGSSASSSASAESTDEQAKADLIDQRATEAKAAIQQAAAGQQASAPAESAVAKAAPAVGEKEQSSAEPDLLGLDAQRTPANENRNYQQRNLIADFFTQRAGSEDGTQRPLAKIKDFLSSVKADPKSAFAFLNLKQDDITAEQNNALTTFVLAAGSWAETIKSNLVQRADSAYHFNDLVQFLINEHGDLAENVKTAISYAAFSWVAENASRSALNTDAEINALLNRSEDELVDPSVKARLGLVGSRESVVINALGQRIVQALGLKATKDAPLNLQPQLEAALGAHAMKLLMDKGILIRTTILGEEMRTLTGNMDTRANAQFKFLALTRDDNMALHPNAERIAGAVKGSKGVLDKLFSVEPGLRMPASEPQPVRQTSTKSGQEIPSAQAKLVEKENAAEHRLNEDMWNLVSAMEQDDVLAMAGAEAADNTVHIFRRAGLKAKNDGLVREYQRLKEFFTGRDIAAPLFFEHDIWKQQRVGILTNMINPQASKLHRHMVYRPSWEASITVNDQAAIDNFLLRVAEGMGVKTDKQGNARSLAEVHDKLVVPEIRAAIEALRNVVGKREVTAAMQAAVRDGVAMGGENFHTLASLMAVARYEEALANKETSFTTQMMGEVDGVTNGPMLSHLLSGAAATVGSLFELLNKGGFYEMGSASNQYNLWREVAGHLDLYETTTSHMMDAVTRFATDGIFSAKGKQILSAQRVSQLLPAIYAFTGNLTEGDKVVKAGRDIIKTPLTAMVFGSSVGKAVDSMADRFIEAVYGKIEKLAAIESDGARDLARKQLLTHLETLGLEVMHDATVEQLMENSLSPRNVAALKDAFKTTIGAAVRETMASDFKAFLDQRTAFNNTAQLAFGMYDAAYRAVRDAYVAELMASGAIASRVTKNGKTVALHDLTGAQKAELDRRLAGLKPVLATAFSNESKQPGAGLVVADTDRTLSERPGYTNEVHFGAPFKDNGAASVSVHAYERELTDPGVAMAPTSVHSTDAHISLHAGENTNSLNIHDARGAGVNGLAATARALNQATWNAMMQYSPATEMANTLLQVVHAVPALFERSGDDLRAQLAKNMTEVLAKIAEKQDLPVESVLDMMVRDAKAAAFAAEDMKLQALEQMGHIDQYALEGGHYEVTPAERVAAAEARANLSAELAKDDIAALDQVAALLKDGLAGVKQTIPAAAAAPKGEPAVKGDKALVDFFQAGEVRTVAEVATQLGKMGLTGFQSKLLASLVKVLGARGSEYTVRYVTGATTADQILEQPKVPSHAWFVSRNGKNEIYVLGAEFADSAVTIEALLHEMVHATVARVIDGATGEAKVLVDGLEELRAAAAQAIAERKLAGLDAAVSSVQELVAWGMTNPRFQQVLAAVQVSQAGLEKSLATRLLDGMTNFINSLVGLVFGKQNEAAANGMRALVTNVSGLLKAASQMDAQQGGTINQSMATNLQDLTTTELFDALAQLNTAPVDPAFSEHLRGLLDGIVEKVHGPFGSFAARVTATLTTPLDVWANAKATGQAPFAARSLFSGLAFSEQEAFVTEQVEATVRAVMADKDGSTTAAYRELVRLYDDVKEKLKPADFPSQAAYDFVFGIQSGADGRSEYLSRFAALGLGNAQFNALLQFQTPIKSGSLAGLSMADKLHAIFERFMTWIHGKLTHTFEGQEANEKLTSLVTQLVDIQNKQRMKLAQSPLVMVDFIENTFRQGAEAARRGADKFGQSALFKNSQNGFIKATGAIISTVAGDRVDKLMDALQIFRDTHLKEKNGLAMGLVNEARGAHAGNAMFHRLLRLSKAIEGTRKDLIANTSAFVMESFKDGGKYLTKEMKAAVSAVLLRTDVASLLGPMNVADIQRLLEDKAHLASTINQAERELNRFAPDTLAYVNGARLLAYYKATGKLAGTHVLMNAENIAQLLGTPRAGRVSQADARAAAPIIDRLTTLYALSYVDETQRGLAAEVLQQESGRGAANGIEMVLKLHQRLQQESSDRLFNTSGALRMKGYLPEIYNPYVQIRVADSRTEGKELVEQGYVETEHALTMDDADPAQNTHQRIYVLRDGGLVQHLTGVFSYTGQRAKGARTHNGDLGLLSAVGQANRAKMDDIRRDKAAGIQEMLTRPIDPTQVRNQNFMAPVLNSAGEVVNYRYMMAEATKAELLQRDNRFEHMLGSMAGNVYDKQMTAEQNRRAVQALRDQYQDDFSTRAASYVRVGAQSTDPEMREIWRLLPETTKQAIREVWGSNNMMVRIDLLDINFGYRKMSITDPFGIPVDERDRFEKLYVEFFEGLLGKKAGLWLRRGEDIWQALVREAKDTMVVKSGVTLLGNFTSNVSELIWFGVPMTDIVRHHRVALKGVMAHRKDSAELARLQIQLDTGHFAGASRADVEHRVAQLKDSMARNPVRELIDAGLMPTIVEDVAAEDDQYSFKGRFTRKVDAVVDSLNPHVVAAGKLLVMAHDTPIYKALSYGTQVSDFVARYTLYQHVIARAKDPLDAQTAVQLVSDAFVNYDVPSHRTVQYANDMGLVYFSKYYLRIQKVIALLYRQNPGRALMLLTLGHFLDFIPLLTHSSALQRFGNPFSMGAFESISSLDEMATVNALMTPFR